MIIGKYIRQLLDERKRVILPGFGNLEVKELAQGISPSGNRIDPPGLSVMFDKGFSKDDGLLASAFAEGAELQQEEAEQRVLELVDAIKFALDKGEPYAIAETGTFRRDDDGKVFFQIDSGWVLEPDQYGLESMDLLELEELPIEEEEKPEINVAKTEPVSKASGVKPAGKTVGAKPGKASISPPVSRPVEKRTRHINKWKVVWIIAGALVIILAALIFIPSDNIRKPKPKYPTPVETSVAPETPGTPSEEQNASDPSTTESQNDQPEAVTPAEETPAESLELKYIIVAGSFKHLKYASDLQDQLIARGYAAEVMVTENRMYRVSVASFASKKEAEKNLAVIKAAKGLESCWLLSN